MKRKSKVEHRFVFQGKIGQTLGKIILGSDDGPPTPKQEKAVKIDVIRGDILSSKCEVMVNTTGSDFNLTRKFNFWLLSSA